MTSTTYKIPRPKLGDALIPREQECCYHAANGLQNREIAAKIGLSHETVKLYLRDAFIKLGIHNRIALLRFFRPVRIPVSKREEFDASDSLALDMISAGWTDEYAAKQINERAPGSITPDEFRVCVSRLRRQSGLKTRMELAIWWLNKQDKLIPASKSLTEKQEPVPA